jgi:hypothetical protein
LRHVYAAKHHQHKRAQFASLKYSNQPCANLAAEILRHHLDLASVTGCNIQRLFYPQYCGEVSSAPLSNILDPDAQLTQFD